MTRSELMDITAESPLLTLGEKVSTPALSQFTILASSADLQSKQVVLPNESMKKENSRCFGPRQRVIRCENTK